MTKGSTDKDISPIAAAQHFTQARREEIIPYNRGQIRGEAMGGDTLNEYRAAHVRGVSS